MSQNNTETTTKIIAHPNIEDMVALDVIIRLTNLAQQSNDDVARIMKIMYRAKEEQRKFTDTEWNIILTPSKNTIRNLEKALENAYKLDRATGLMRTDNVTVPRT